MNSLDLSTGNISIRPYFCYSEVESMHVYEYILYIENSPVKSILPYIYVSQ